MVSELWCPSHGDRRLRSPAGCGISVRNHRAIPERLHAHLIGDDRTPIAALLGGFAFRVVPLVSSQSTPSSPACPAASAILGNHDRIAKLRCAAALEAKTRLDVEQHSGLQHHLWVEVKRTDGSHVLIRTIERSLPRNGGKAKLVVCPLCQKPRRALYGWRLNRTRASSVFLTSWECRECTGLRYSSEGGALRLRPLPIVLEGRLFVIRENALRPESCWPYVFVNPLDVKSIL